MPELPSEEQLSIAKKIISSQRNRLCTVCGNSNWIVVMEKFELRKFNPYGALIIGGNQLILNITPIICTICGNTLLFSTDNLLKTENIKAIHFPTKDEINEQK